MRDTIAGCPNCSGIVETSQKKGKCACCGGTVRVYRKKSGSIKKSTYHPANSGRNKTGK